MAEKTRIEKDSLGERSIPEAAYYGIQTLRASENFPISGLRAHPQLLKAYAWIKKACAQTHLDLGLLDRERARAILKACDEILEGKHADQFIVDVFQAGAGTSTHMNVNEVVANRALEILGKKRGEFQFLHPNDHVNMSQSTNDTFPAATHIAVLLQNQKLQLILRDLAEAFSQKAAEFKNILKSARTHLQDAVPITLGQEFKAYAVCIQQCGRELEKASGLLEEVALGGTAAGTGANAPAGFRTKVLGYLRDYSGLPLRRPTDPRMALQSHWPLASYSGTLKNLALELTRIANDLRLLSSGPTTGLAEILLPAVQPGSSIMPGKVNPSLAECLNMVCFQVIGNDLAVSLAAQAGQMDLNVMTPLTAYDLLFSTQILICALPVFTEKCVRDVRADPQRCRDYFEKSLSLAALFNTRIGYAKSAELFKEAWKSQKTIPELALEKKLLTEKELRELLDPKNITQALDSET
ncbi:MAG: aspartate ammonia-lyase [Elusimicrobia bacterium]|nr:aspartate ammonia-lyase [Elusimicrobiota bacterium]